MEHPPGDECHMRSRHHGIYLDAEGPVDQEHPPFWGAHMANDPTWIVPETPVPLQSLTSQANCDFNEDFTLAATRDIKIGDECLALCSFVEEDDEAEGNRKPAAM
jgi:hypothetical protein